MDGSAPVAALTVEGVCLNLLLCPALDRRVTGVDAGHDRPHVPLPCL